MILNLSGISSNDSSSSLYLDVIAADSDADLRKVFQQ